MTRKSPHQRVTYLSVLPTTAPPGRAASANASSDASPEKVRHVTPQAYVDNLLEQVRPRLVKRISRLASNGAVVLDPAELAELLEAGLPDAGAAEMHPYFAAVGPFYDTAGALQQLRGVSKQALESRRGSQTVLAMQTGDGHWLYPAWQFTGQGTIHAALSPVLRQLKGLDRWLAGVWLTNPHRALEGRTPRQALAAYVDPQVVATLAAQDKAALVA